MGIIVSVPDYAVLLILLTVMLVTASLSVLLTAAIGRAAVDTGDRQKFSRALSLYMVVWVLAALALSYFEVIVPQAGQRVPWLGLAIVLPTLLALFLQSRSMVWTAVLDATPLHWLAAIQIYRVIGIIFLVLHADGLLSAYFALSTGWGDIAIGLTAPIVSYLLWLNAPRYFALGLVWCGAGIFDLLFVLYKAINSAPGPLQTTAFDVPTVIIGYFPFPLIPLLIVPISIILHVQMIRKIVKGYVWTATPV